MFFIEISNSLTSTIRTLAIPNNVSRDGCDLFVHQRETFASFFFNISASHLPVHFLSTITTFNLFSSIHQIIEVICKYNDLSLTNQQNY